MHKARLFLFLCFGGGVGRVISFIGPTVSFGEMLDKLKKKKKVPSLKSGKKTE